MVFPWEYRYLSEERLVEMEKQKKRSLRWGIGLLIFFLLALAGGLTGDEGFDAGTVILTVLGIGGGAWLTVKGLLAGRQTEAAKGYERLFSNDRDGVVTLSELARQTGKAPDAVLQELSALFQKNFFRGCVFYRDGEPRVVIGDAMIHERGVGFVSVSCPKCGAVSRVRAGSRSFCQFCGAPLADKEI